jgi:adhesin transport system membrane fusion protein
MARDLSKRDAEFAPGVEGAGRRRGSGIANMILYITVIFLVVAAVWAHYSLIDEVTRGQGRVIPSSHIKVVQNLEGGILSELLVAEGAVVEKDQVLARIDDTTFASNFREARTRSMALRAAAARLNAEVRGTEPEFPADVRSERPDLVAAEMQLYVSRRRELQMAVEMVERSLALVTQELEMSAPLVAEGALSEVEVLRLRRQQNELKGALSDRRNRFLAEAQSELTRTGVELSRVDETNVAVKDRVARTVLKSPVRGVVQKVHTTSVGAVIQPGRDVLEIVPLEDTLLVEAQVSPIDIAFIRPGHQAMVKITAYDYSIYGGLPGEVERISADTMTDERKGESYFKVIVRTKNAQLGTPEKPLPIIPGMTASVDILTARRSVLNYLLKPFYRVQERAFRER